jgi:hypothetical protein
MQMTGLTAVVTVHGVVRAVGAGTHRQLRIQDQPPPPPQQQQQQQQQQHAAPAAATDRTKRIRRPDNVPFKAVKASR